MRKTKTRAGGSAAKSKATPINIDEYLAGVPEPARSTLNKIRAMIRSAAPKEATEAISYGMPAFKYKGSLVWFAAFANHCSFFPGTSFLLPSFQKELKNFEISKGTIRFPVDKPLPAGLVRKLVKARVAQNDLKKSR
jgi:uncharacterized protein YdhG (YjbR/CyaY superfamily)